MLSTVTVVPILFVHPGFEQSLAPSFGGFFLLVASQLAEEDLQNQVSEMGNEVMRATARVSELQQELAERDTELDGLELELQVRSDKLDQLQRCAAQGEKETAEEMRSLKTYIGELKESAAERQGSSGAAPASARPNRSVRCGGRTRQRPDGETREGGREGELARQMEDALEAAEEKMKSDEERVVELRIKVAALEPRSGGR